MKSRTEIIDKALKLKALSERGVGGEAENAKRFYDTFKTKHNITEAELVSKDEYKTSFASYQNAPISSLKDLLREIEKMPGYQRADRIDRIKYKAIGAALFYAFQLINDRK